MASHGRYSQPPTVNHCSISACRRVYKALLLLVAGRSPQQRTLQCSHTLTAVKPGNSRAKMVSHTLCSRGWLLLLARKTGSSLCRCCSVKNAAAAGAARSLGVSGSVKYPLGGGLVSAGSSFTSCRRDFGREGHKCKASSRACRKGKLRLESLFDSMNSMLSGRCYRKGRLAHCNMFLLV